MKKITTPIGNFGPYNRIETLQTCYRCDGNIELPFTVVGHGVISDVVTGDFPAAKRNPAIVQKEIIDATQLRLDTFAKTRNYDSILSACTYATSSSVKFQTEAQCCVTLRDATWTALYDIFTEVESGKRAAPDGFQDIEPHLPELIWPVS